MKLQEALKQLISQFGEDIVGDIKLANLLARVSSLTFPI